jgi:hypothetical protein
MSSNYKGAMVVQGGILRPSSNEPRANMSQSRYDYNQLQDQIQRAFNAEQKLKRLREAILAVLDAAAKNDRPGTESGMTDLLRVLEESKP